MKTYRLLFIFFSIFLLNLITVPQASAVVASECVFSRDLTVGSINSPTTNDVLNLQNFMIRKGFLTSNDGERFTPALQSAVSAYQISKFITPTNGYFGPVTRTAVVSECIAEISGERAMYSLVTSTSGTGSGRVLGAGTYPEGSTVTVEALPATGSKFSGWNNGRASGKALRYSFALTEDQRANAIFDLIKSPVVVVATSTTPAQVVTSGQALLQVIPRDYWTGVVNSGGQVTGSKNIYNVGETVTITAVPNSGYVFAGWDATQDGIYSGVKSNCHGQGATCTFVINGNTTERPIFTTTQRLPTLKQELTVSPKGTGSGTVVNKNGVTLVPNQKYEYSYFEYDNFTPVASAGSVFAGWDNRVCQWEWQKSNSSCVLYMQMSHTLMPIFNSSSVTTATTTIATTTSNGTVFYTFNVTKSGTGSGRVTGGGSYAAGQTAVATAVPDEGSKISGWNGPNCTGTRTTCTVLMNGNKSGNVIFTKINPVTSALSSPSSIYSAIKSALNLQKGSAQPGVMALQKYLNLRGYVVNETPGQAGSPGNESSYFGDKTEQAVVRFQRDNGIPATGFVGAQTKQVMETN